MVGGSGLWVRWILRDLRARWVHAAVLAMVVALGVGIYAGLTATSSWRTESNDASYQRANYHDVRVTLPAGASVPDGRLREILSGVDTVAAVDERLVTPIQVDASTPAEDILVSGRLIGTPVASDGTDIDRPDVQAGRGLRPRDAGRSVAVVDVSFAEHYDLPATTQLTISGDEQLTAVGRVASPEYYVVFDNLGRFFAESQYAVIFTSLETAQQLTDAPGQVNEAVATLRRGAVTTDTVDAVRDAVASALPSVDATVIAGTDEAAYEYMYDDITSDQRLYDIIAMLLFVGAAVGAFNLARRQVDAQRRQIGVGMALGVPPGALGLRPLATGAQIAVAGIVLGAAVTIGVERGMEWLLRSYFPLPVWRTGFAPRAFALAAGFGFATTLAGVAYPVWRAVRVAPIDAIAPRHHTKRTRISTLLTTRHRGGRSLRLLPIRNLTRAPQRVLLTVVAVAAAVTLATATIGLLDSFDATISQGEQALVGGPPTRLDVVLDDFYAPDDRAVTSVQDAAGVGATATGVQFDGRIDGNGADIDSIVQLFDYSSALWQPPITRGRLDDTGLIISRKAADDLDVGVGDAVTVRHPRPTRGGAAEYDRTPVTVSGIHSIPLRSSAYMDRDAASTLGLDDVVNALQVRPTAGTDVDKLKATLFDLPPVATALAAQDVVDVFREVLIEFIAFLRGIEIAALVLIGLVTLNAAAITFEERSREHATMLAFGLPIRSVIASTMVEGAAIGVLGAALGAGLGVVVLRWVTTVELPEVVPSVGVLTYIEPTNILIAIAVTTVAAATTQTIGLRRLHRMNLANRLRAME